MEANQSLVPRRTSPLNPSVAVLERDLVLLRSADKPTQEAYMDGIKFTLLGLIAGILTKDAKYLKLQSSEAAGSKERQALVQARVELIRDFYSLFRATGQNLPSSQIIDVLAESS